MAANFQFKSSLIDYTYDGQGYSYTITTNDWTTLDVDIITFGQFISLMSDVYSGGILVINKHKLLDKFELSLSAIGVVSGGNTIGLITQLADVLEADVTNAVSPSVIFTLNDNVNVALALLAPIDSPTLTGTPQAPTPTIETNNDQIATTSFVHSLTTNLCPLTEGIIPSIYLPSYIDDALEFANFASFPVDGESGKIYISANDNLIYRWTGSVYVLIGDGTSVDVVAAGSAAFPRYDAAQSLSDAAKAQLLTNIGAKKSYNMLTKTASYALQLADFKDSVDLYDKVYLRMNVASANNVTVDTTLTSLPNLTEISVRNVGAGFTTLVASGTTLNGLLVFSAVNEVKTLVKVGANEWDVVGALA